MRKYVEDKTFKDELELWFFLQDLKGQKLGVPDGFYSVELSSDENGLSYKDMIFHETRKGLRDITDDMIIESRFICFVQNAEPWCVGVETPYLRAQEEIRDGSWQLLGFHDALSPEEGPRQHFTEEDYARACDALVEALVVSSKKVA